MKKKVLLSVFTCVLALLNLSSCGTSGTNAGNEPEKAIIAEEIGAKYIVPDVTGKQPEDAITMLKTAGFTNIRSNISDETELKAYEWIVTEQSVSAGESLVYDQPIVLLCNKHLQLYLDLKSEGNFLFSKYDVDIFLDGEQVGSITNGANFTFLADVLDGAHEIKVTKAGDQSIAAVEAISISDNTTYQCTIAHDKKAIDLKKQNITQDISGSALKVPNAVGMVLSDAQSAMKNTGFINIRSYADNDSIWNEDNWIVVEQNQEAGTALDKTEEINLKCIKLDQFFEQEYVGKNLYEIIEKATAQGFSIEAKDKESYSVLTLEGQTREWLENWEAVSASKSVSKTARVYVKEKVKATTTTTTTTTTVSTAETQKVTSSTTTKVTQEEKKTTLTTTTVTTTRITTETQRTTRITTSRTEAPRTTYTTTRATSARGGSQYVGNINSHIFHVASCASVSRMNESNKWYFSSRDDAIAQGYTPCQRCHP